VTAETKTMIASAIRTNINMAVLFPAEIQPLEG